MKKLANLKGVKTLCKKDLINLYGNGGGEYDCDEPCEVWRYDLKRCWNWCMP